MRQLQLHVEPSRRSAGCRRPAYPEVRLKFVSLHTHTTFSYGDGFAPPKRHVERAAELGMDALAVTEHGNVSSHVQLDKAAREAGIQPIFGLEAYTSHGKNLRKWHLTMLAASPEGYRNLNRIVTRSYDEGFYRWPTVSGEMLREASEGLIILSGCADSQLACTLLGGKGVELHEDAPDIKSAINLVRKYQRLLGDRYYLEVQQFPGLRRSCILNQAYAEISHKTGVPLVATADVHYPSPDDNEMQKILHAATRATGTVAAAEAEWEYNIRLTYPESDHAILENLRRTGLSRADSDGAVTQTAEIAQRCKVDLPTAERLRFPSQNGKTSVDLIWDWLRRGWNFRAKSNRQLLARKREYAERVQYEMKLIVGKDFVDYFLMLSDLVRFAKNSGIAVGPARGSAAASLICYLLRITEVDPMQFPNMMFERFIDEEREDLPDVDLDFASGRRDEVRQRAVWRYGNDRVANIGTFTKYRGKNAIDDVARVYKIPKYEAEAIKNLVIERSGGDSRFDASLADTRDMFPQARAVFDRHPEFENSIRLEGNMRGFGIHAAGIVVSNTPITDFCAMYSREVGSGHNKRKLSALAYDKKDAEHLGLLKLDALGLNTMEMIERAIKMIGMKLEELYNVPLDDEKTMAAFKRGDVVGIFQFEGRATRLVNADVKPDNFMELADINALARPGPLFSGATAAYIDTKWKRRQPQHLHPIVDKYVAQSKYQIIYQEQVLATLREMGGFPGSVTGALRKIISLKLGEAQFNNWHDDFINGAAKHHGIKKDLAEKVWAKMVTSATYSFNIAHCVSYSMLGFWCQWLKQHYPTEFYAAALSIMKGDKAQRAKEMRLMVDAARHGITIDVPSIKHSGVSWSIAEKGRVVAGFQQIFGIGEKTAEMIVETRDREGMDGWDDLIKVRGIGPKTLERIKDFVETDDPFGLTRVTRRLKQVRKLIAGNSKLPNPTHASDDIPTDADNLHVVWVGIPRSKEYKDFVEDERARSGKDPAEIIRSMKDPHLVTSCVLRCYDDGDEEVYLRFNRWQFPKFKSALESVRLEKDIVIAVGIKRQGFGVNLQMRNLFVIDPD